MSKTSDFFSRPENYLDKDYNVTVRGRIIQELVGNIEGKKILDIGCGDARVSLHFADKNELTLIDASPGMLELARKNTPQQARSHVTYLLSSLEEAQLKEENYDLIIAMGVLAHLSSWKDALGTLNKAVRKGGLVVVQISDSAKAMVRSQLKPTGKRLHALNRIEFKSLVEVCDELGLKLLTEKRYGFTVRGMGILPNKFLYHFTLATARYRLLSKIATEVIGVFQKK